MNNLINIDKINKYSMLALLYEVSSSPKPGLVDRLNSGAHKDMNYFDFLDSTIALNNFFGNCYGFGYLNHEKTEMYLKNHLRKIGLQAENDMYNSTNNINTHKGIIFSLGWVCFSIGYGENKYKRKITFSELKLILRKFLKNSTLELINDKSLDKCTNGEKLFKKFGITGVRGELEKGLPSVLDFSIEIFKDLMQNNSLNNACIDTLLHLMMITEDSNIINRGGLKSLAYVKDYANKAIKLGGITTKEGYNFISNMNNDFIDKNISPGGSADLLVITIFLYFYEREMK